MDRRFKKRSYKFVVSLDKKDYYVVTSLSRDRAIRLVSAITDTSHRNVEIHKIKVLCSTGHNPPPKVGDRPGQPGGAGGKNTGNAILSSIKAFRPGVLYMSRPGMRFKRSRITRAPDSGRVEKVSQQEALALLEGNSYSEK